MPTHKVLWMRFVLFALASMSFACLLGQFYGLWSMRAFACVALLPCTLALIGIAAFARPTDKVLWDARTRIIEGAMGGFVAAVAYDLFRLPFVLNGYPLFKVFPEFGKMLLGANGPEWAVQALGWAYHFSNGMALGIMFLAFLPDARPPRKVLWSAVGWALCVEAILLLTPYRNFFKIGMPFATFLVLTLSAHVIFGLTLGAWCGKRFHVLPSRSST